MAGCPQVQVPVTATAQLCLVEVDFKRKILAKVIKNNTFFKLRVIMVLKHLRLQTKTALMIEIEIALQYKNKTFGYTNFPLCCQVSESLSTLGFSEDIVLFGVTCPLSMMIQWYV